MPPRRHPPHAPTGHRPGRRLAVRRAGAARQRGFTLIEAILSAGLLGFLAVTATFFWVNGFRLVQSVNADSQAIADARAVLERLAREVREVKYDTGSGAYCISTMQPAQMVFNKSTSPTSVTAGCGGANPTNTNNDYAVNIQLPANSSSLNLAYIGTLAAPAISRAMTGQATAFAMRYLDAAFATTASTSAVRFVELTLTVQPGGVQATQARTVVALRNN